MEAPRQCLGIDPGLNRTGYLLLERTARGPRVREGGVVRSTREGTLAERVYEIGSGVRELLDEFRPDVAGIEEVFSFSRNPKTAVLMAHARGAVLMTLAERGIPVVHFSARRVKQLLTGSGRASKEQMQHAITNELALDRVPEPNDVADAAAVALCAYYLSGRPGATGDAKAAG